jgi:hypothetical protein
VRTRRLVDVYARTKSRPVVGPSNPYIAHTSRLPCGDRDQVADDRMLVEMPADVGLLRCRRADLCPLAHLDPVFSFDWEPRLRRGEPGL